LHGMNASSGQFQLHMGEFEKYISDHGNCIKLFIPEILNKGMAILETCGNDVYSKIAKELPNIINLGIPIIFVGISNGGRIALFLYSKIMETHNYKNTFITTLGSPLRGTYIANLTLMTGTYYLSKYRNNSDVLHELKFNSKISSELVDRCTSFDNFRTNTLFYTSTNDYLIYPHTCGILDNHNNKIVDGVGHNGLILYYHKDQVLWCISLVDQKN